MNLKRKSSTLTRRGSPAFAGALRAGRRRAFTLFELMVVLAIIAMLAGLLGMTIRDARERARTTHCRNNLRQFGIAIGKYASDWEGYFIQPGYQAGYKGGTGIASGDGLKTREVGEFSLSPYGGRMDGPGEEKVGYVWYDTYGGFVGSYVRSVTIEKGVTHCPEVDMNIFQTNSSIFKGLAYDSYWHSYNKDTVGELTTYAINGNAVYQLKSALKDCVFAFVDWNAAQGWGASVGWGAASDQPSGPSYWVMVKTTTGSAVRETLYKNAGTEASRPSKNAPSYRTEIGYHHRSGTNPMANYVAMDGHVGWISSNAPETEFHQLFYGY